MNTPESGGATPLDPDEARGLIPSHVATQGQLNEWEHQNIVDGERWAFGRRHKDPLTANFVRRLHRRMFGDTWTWAGEWRMTEKNIGIAPERIRTEIQQLLDNVATQLALKSYPIREIAARCHHRMVQIHPFPNGNGRFARTFVDLLLARQGESRFTWGDSDLVTVGEARERYIAGLQAADAQDYGPLLTFLEV